VVRGARQGPIVTVVLVVAVPVSPLNLIAPVPPLPLLASLHISECESRHRGVFPFCSRAELGLPGELMTLVNPNLFIVLD
jgi:hypothetical protein